MKLKLHHTYSLLLGILVFSGSGAFAQNSYFSNSSRELKSLKNIEIIISVDPKTNEVNELFLKKENVEQQLYELKGNCYRCDFYLGSAEGNIKVKGSQIIQGKKCRFTINTRNNLMPGQEFLPGKQFGPGTQYNLAGIKTMVVSNLEGSFIVESN